MDDVREFFKEIEGDFTVYIVEQRFVVNRGAGYFRSFKGKLNYIDTNAQIEKLTSKILRWISKKIPDVATLTKICLEYNSPLTILDVISSLSKIFSIHEHQAAGPEVIDPIIIQEGKILPKYLKQMISLHRASILRPVIIILLEDNDFDRAKKLLSGCPHRTNLKMIRNNGQIEIFKVINCGTQTPDEFIDAFVHHCFSTCSQTKRDILLNDEWAEESLIRLFSPSLMQVRTSFLFGDKQEAKGDLSNLIFKLTDMNGRNDFDRNILKAFECMSRLFRVYCNDLGGDDIKVAYAIAKELNHDILLAHVYRYSFFIENHSFEERLILLDKAHDIFKKNNMEDHAIYSRNNRIIRQFDTEKICIHDFRLLQEEAIFNVPGLVGMSQILNNTGVAHLMSGSPDEAITFFNKGLDYANRPEYIVQRIALLCNHMIARTYAYEPINQNELRKTMNLIFDHMGSEKLPFISGRYAMNIISLAFNKNTALAKDLIRNYPIKELLQKAFHSNKIGSGQLALQMLILDRKFDDFALLDNFKIPKKLMEVTGARKRYITKYGLNPFFFSTWL